MSTLTEVEIFECMADNVKLAAACCDALADRSIPDDNYSKLRDALSLIEGCCKQASAHREDTRWLPIGLLMADCHAKAGNWLRGYMIDGERIHLAPGERNLNFVELAKHLRSLLKVIDQTKNQRTGRVGMILPETPKEFLRENKPHRVKLPEGELTPSGILIPHGVAA